MCGRDARALRIGSRLEAESTARVTFAGFEQRIETGRAPECIGLFE